MGQAKSGLEFHFCFRSGQVWSLKLRLGSDARVKKIGPNCAQSLMQATIRKAQLICLGLKTKSTMNRPIIAAVIVVVSIKKKLDAGM